MGHDLTTRNLPPRNTTALDAARDAIRRASLPEDLLDTIFTGVPLDFPLLYRRRLPLRVDLLGMIGITLRGRVYLHERARSISPRAFLRLLRHESEHVRQQREERLFYMRYITGFIRALLPLLFRSGAGSLGERFHRAYLRIPAERAAYAADERALELLSDRRGE